MTGNLLTLADARAAVKQFVNGGSCNVTEIDARIAEAEERLWPHADWRLTRRRMKIIVAKNCFCLPIEVEKILHYTVNGRAGNLFSDAYEYLQVGMGDLDARYDGTGIKDLVDQGEFPTQFDVPIKVTFADDAEDVMDGVWSGGYRLAAFSTAGEDVARSMVVRGLDAHADEICTAEGTLSRPGVTLGINRWVGGVEGQIQGAWADMQVTTAQFRQVTRVNKELTRGAVSLYAVNPTTHEMYLLSKMTPWDTVPSYRRYRITNFCCEDDTAVMTALVKVRYRRAQWTDDVLSIQHMGALKNAVMAIEAENKGDLNGATALEARGIAMLLADKATRELASGVPALIDTTWELRGAQVNHGYGV